jgi:lipopolysaccharide cholinephosphotransferase
MECGMNETMIQKAELEMLVEMDQVCREYNLTYSLAYGTVLGAVRHKGFIPWDLDIDIMVDIDSYQHFCDVLQSKLSERYAIYSYRTRPGYEFLFSRLGRSDRRHDELYIDIFPMVGLPKSPSGRKLYSKLAYFIFRGYFLKKVDARANYKEEPAKRRIALLAKVVLFAIPPILLIRCYERLQKTFPINGSMYIYNFCGLYKHKEIMLKSFLVDRVTMDFEGHLFPVPKEWDRYLTHIYGDYMTPRKTNYV